MDGGNEPKWSDAGTGGPRMRMVPAAALEPYEKNARTHSDAQIAQIVASIREFGFTNPILTDGKRGVIAGHGRLLAALKMGMAQVPVVELAHLTATQRRAYVIADNKLALNAGWDLDVLAGEMGGLKDDGFDLSLTGFDDGELARLLGPGDGLTDADDAPEPPVVPVSRLGDVWTLGAHRLVCGDSTDALVVETALAGAKPHLMVTDPPYGVDYDPEWRNNAVAAEAFDSRRAVGKVSNDDRHDWRDAWTLFGGDVAYVWHGGVHAASVAESLSAAGLDLRAQIIWRKQHFIIGRGHYHWGHEPCWYAVRKGATGHWSGDRKQQTVWEIHAQIGWESARPDNQDKATGHSTQKPIECMRRPIENNSAPGDAVYDPFVGSGTTIIAAEQTGRACCAIELSPAYVDVAVLRWQAFTGKVATLNGRPFADVAAERRPV